MAEVVEQRRGHADGCPVVVDPLVLGQLERQRGDPREVALHHVGRADHVGEARVLAPGNASDARPSARILRSRWTSGHASSREIHRSAAPVKEISP